MTRHFHLDHTRGIFYEDFHDFPPSPPYEHHEHRARDPETPLSRIYWHCCVCRGAEDWCITEPGHILYLCQEHYEPFIVEHFPAQPRRRPELPRVEVAEDLPDE